SVSPMQSTKELPYRPGISEAPKEGAQSLVTRRSRKGVNVSSRARAVVPDLHGQIKVEDVRRCQSAARPVNRKHRVAIDLVEINVFQHGAAPVRQIQEVHARLVRVYAGLDRNPAHRLPSGEQQVQVVSVSAAAFLDDGTHRDAQILPGM